MKKNREYFLKETEKLINGPRAKDYGPVKKNHQRIADIWSILLEKKLKEPITPEEAVACMIGVKVARLAEDINKDGSLKIKSTDGDYINLTSPLISEVN